MAPYVQELEAEFEEVSQLVEELEFEWDAWDWLEEQEAIEEAWLELEEARANARWN